MGTLLKGSQAASVRVPGASKQTGVHLVAQLDIGMDDTRDVFHVFNTHLSFVGSDHNPDGESRYICCESGTSAALLLQQYLNMTVSLQ